MSAISINRSLKSMIPEYFSQTPGLDPVRSRAGRPAKDRFAAQEQSFRANYLGGTLGQARIRGHAVDM